MAEELVLHSIDTNRLRKSLGLIFRTIHESRVPVVITRFKRNVAILLPLDYNLQVEVLAVRFISKTYTPHAFRDMISTSVKEVFSGAEGPNPGKPMYMYMPPAFYIPDIPPESKRAVIIRFVRADDLILLPFYTWHGIFDKSLRVDNRKYKSLPFTDMRKNRH